jgi:hypothetical protein
MEWKLVGLEDGTIAVNAMTLLFMEGLPPGSTQR